MELGLILTNDWELFASGCGEFYELQIHPLRAMLAVLGQHHAKLTVMAEVGQQWAHMQAGSDDVALARIARDWEVAVKEALAAGHDVQLHLHENWLRAKRVSAGWHLGQHPWAVSGTLPGGGGNAFKKGVEYLESLLRGVNDRYRCRVARLGAFVIDPSGTVVERYRDANLLADTSVVRGQYQKGWYDHRAAHSSLAYRTRQNDLLAAGTDGIIEAPIYSSSGRNPGRADAPEPEEQVYRRCFELDVPAHDLEWQAECRKMAAARYPPSQRLMSAPQKSEPRSAEDSSTRVFPLSTEDIPSSVFVRMLEDLMSDAETIERFSGMTLPVVAIGHTKFMHDTHNLARILEGIAGSRVLKGSVRYMTMSEALPYLADLARRNSGSQVTGAPPI